MSYETEEGMIACWSAKGGSGASVVAALLAIAGAGALTERVLLLDLGGDQPSIFGLDQIPEVGLGSWLVAGSAVSAESLSRLVVEVGDGVDLLPWGSSGTVGASALRADQADRILETIDTRPVVVDAGLLRSSEDLPGEVVTSAAHSLLVTRACFLGLRRASSLATKPTGIVLIEEEGRSLGRRDVEEVLQVPVLATLPWDPAIARKVDAGRLPGRLPRPFRSLHGLAERLLSEPSELMADRNPVQ